MAAGQASFSVAADVAALGVLEAEPAIGELDRGRQHVATLRRVLQMNAVYAAGGMQLSTVPHAALALSCSENRAARLLVEGLALAELPGGLEAVDGGLLTVEQSAVLVGQLAPLPFPVRLRVWRRLQARLSQQGVLPPARLAELLRRWILDDDFSNHRPPVDHTPPRHRPPRPPDHPRRQQLDPRPGGPLLVARRGDEPGSVTRPYPACGRPGVREPPGSADLDRL